MSSLLMRQGFFGGDRHAEARDERARLIRKHGNLDAAVKRMLYPEESEVAIPAIRPSTVPAVPYLPPQIVVLPQPSKAAEALKRRRARENEAGSGWSKDQWVYVLADAGYKCLRCGCGGRLVPDHVIPLFHGGSHDINNIQPLCYKCNFFKGLSHTDFRAIQPRSTNV